MKTIWSLDGLRVQFSGGVAQADADPCFVGYAVLDGRVYEWSAYPKPDGYEVWATDDAGRLERHSGPTLNLGLEVASAVRRF